MNNQIYPRFFRISMRIFQTFKTFKDMVCIVLFKIFNLLESVILDQESFQKVFWHFQMEILLLDVSQPGKLTPLKFFLQIHSKEQTRKKDIKVTSKHNKSKMDRFQEIMDFIISNTNLQKQASLTATMEIPAN